MTFRDDLTGHIPNMRAFAISLCGNATLADDLVQEALQKALGNADKFEDGTNLRAWLLTILRNTYFSQFRKRRREVEDVDGEYAGRQVSPASQEDHLEVQALRAALKRLPDNQREAILLVGAEGFSYDEAAAIAGCAVGTVKSRVSRARERLEEELRPDLEAQPVS